MCPLKDPWIQAPDAVNPERSQGSPRSPGSLPACSAFLDMDCSAVAAAVAAVVVAAVAAAVAVVVVVAAVAVIAVYLVDCGADD